MSPRPSAVAVDRLESRCLLSGIVLNGVQAIADDQPQINALFRLSSGGAPLTAPDPVDGTPVFDVTGFLDTGTSSILLSQETAQGLGVQSATFGGQPVAFTDIGIGGGQQFDVSQPLYTSLANYSPAVDGTDPAQFTQNFGPIRTEINQQPADPNLGDPLDIFGMPVMQGKVAVFDPSPIDGGNSMNTYVYDPGTPYRPGSIGGNPGIPATNLHVKLSQGSFAGFTTIAPSGAPGPTLSDNPFIGPNPIALLAGHNDGTPGVTIADAGLSTTGSFLFDTGAVSSFISTAMAARVHVRYQPGTEGTANPVLVDSTGKAIANQFTEPLGGVGGTTTAAGFFLDSLTLPTTEGAPITFTHAPVLVLDVTAQNPTTHQTITLDGDFGMNNLVSSTDANLAAAHTGDFRWFTFDQHNGVLGLELPGAVISKTGAIAGTVYNDLNADSVHQSTEPGAAGFTVTLHNQSDANSAQVDATIATDAKGNYAFSNLDAGTYVLRETPRAGWRATTATSLTTTVAAGATAAGKTFLVTQKAQIQGTVFYDKNGNGKFDAGEALAGWRVYIQLTASTGYVSIDPSAVTDKTGAWTLRDLSAGAYTVRLVQLSGYKLGSPVGGSFRLTVTAGQILIGKAFIEHHA